MKVDVNESNPRGIVVSADNMHEHSALMPASSLQAVTGDDRVNGVMYDRNTGHFYPTRILREAARFLYQVLA
jgi:hypothetical protein